MKRNTYQVVNKFVCGGKKMVTVKMNEEVCVMDLTDYKKMIRDEKKNAY